MRELGPMWNLLIDYFGIKLVIDNPLARKSAKPLDRLG
jgi:hypothetical protein